MGCWHNQGLQVLEDLSVKCLLCNEIIGKAQEKDGVLYFNDGILIPPEVRETVEKKGRRDGK